MAIFLPSAASPTLTSFGGIAQLVAESNSVDSISLPSGSLSPTLIAMGSAPRSSKGKRGRRNDTDYDNRVRPGKFHAAVSVSLALAACAAGEPLTPPGAPPAMRVAKNEGGTLEAFANGAQ